MSKRGQEKRAPTSFPFPRIKQGHKEKNNDEKDSKKGGTESICSEDSSLNLDDKFSGQGICYKAKLIGVDPVSGPRGDKLCHSSMQRLKALVKEARSHKQRISLHISFDGVILKDEKTGDIISSHSIPMISYISRDITDKRAFGFVYGSSDTGHQFYGIKTEKSAVPVMKTIGELFTYVYEAKKRAQSGISGRSSKLSCNESDLSSEKEDNFFCSNPVKNEPKRASEFDKWNETVPLNDPFMEISNLKEVISSVKSASDPYANWESFDNPLDSSQSSFSSKNSTVDNSSGTMSKTSFSSGNEANSSSSSKYSRMKSNTIIRLKPPVSTSRRHREEVIPHHHPNSSTSSNGVFDHSLSSNSSSNSVHIHSNVASQNSSADSSSLFGPKDIFSSPPNIATQQEKRLDLPQVGNQVNSQAMPLPRLTEEYKFQEFDQTVRPPAYSSVASPKQITESVEKSDDRYAVFSQINSMTCSIFDCNSGDIEVDHRLNDNNLFTDSHLLFNNSNKLFEPEFDFNSKDQRVSQVSQVSDAHSFSSPPPPAPFVDPTQKLNRESFSHELSNHGGQQSFSNFPKVLTTSSTPNPFDTAGYPTQTAFSDGSTGMMDPSKTGNMSPDACFSDSNPTISSNNFYPMRLSSYETLNSREILGNNISGSIYTTQEARPSSSTSTVSRNPFLDDFFSNSNDDLCSNSSASTSQKFGDFSFHPASDRRVPVDSSKETVLSSLFKDLDCSSSSPFQNHDAVLYGLSSNLFQPIAHKSNPTSPAAWESPKPGLDTESNRSWNQDMPYAVNSQSLEPNTFALMSRDPAGPNPANDPFAVDPSVERVASAVSFATDVSHSSASHSARSEAVISPSPPPRPPPRPREPNSSSPPPIPPRPHHSIGMNTGDLYASPPPLPKKSSVLGQKPVANPFSILPTNSDDDFELSKHDFCFKETPLPPLPLPQRKICSKVLSSGSYSIRSTLGNYTQDPAKVSKNSMIAEQNSSSEPNNKQNITQSSNSAFGPFSWDFASLPNNSKVSIENQSQSNSDSSISKSGQISRISPIARTNDSCTPPTASSQLQSKDSDGIKLDTPALEAPFFSNTLGNTQFSTPLTNHQSVNLNWLANTTEEDESQLKSKCSQFTNISSIGSSDASLSQMLSSKKGPDFSIDPADFPSTSPKNTETSKLNEFSGEVVSHLETDQNGMCRKASPFAHFDPDHTSPPERNIFKKAGDPFADDFFKSS
ncbi:uncharacterized protein LOC141858173 isoform X1 [Brevipalpus obovatus]|uniref:uncharacterized protein LOC141858173 isoform X1 n=1 Tax=Brevipalpus obovatus TaxID=246614 RepID=UPI003D9F1774